MRWNHVHLTSLTKSCFRMRLHWNSHLLISYTAQFITFIPRERLSLPFQPCQHHPLKYLFIHQWNQQILLWSGKLKRSLQLLQQTFLEKCIPFVLFVMWVDLPKCPKKKLSTHLKTVWTTHPLLTVLTVLEVVLAIIVTTLVTPAQGVPLIIITITTPTIVIIVLILVLIAPIAPVPVLIIPLSNPYNSR